MIKLNNRTIYDDGTVICTEAAVVEMLYSGRDISTVVVEPNTDVELYNKSDQYLDTNYGEIATGTDPIYKDVNWFEYWMTPEPYATMDVENFIFEKCKNENEVQRVTQELKLYNERNMIPVLKHLVYLTDVWRQQNIFWGVGRGSSVGSFVLYLIGINRINPLEYGLEIDEFLK